MQIQRRNLKPAPVLGQIVRRALPMAVLCAGLLSGCSMFKPRDHVVVGSIPDDYRTNHPITIAEREAAYDIAVANAATGLLPSQHGPIQGFMNGYDRTNGSQVKVMVPAGASNTAAARKVAGDIVHLLVKEGVNAGRIVTYTYDAGSGQVAAPVRISYTRLTASTEKCGRWDADLTANEENKHWTNFGCSYQNNLAAQISNPADLLGPRKSGDIDSARRHTTIENYRKADAPFSSETDYSW